MYDIMIIGQITLDHNIDFDGREEGQRPYCLFDFFPEDYLLVSVFLQRSTTVP